MRYFNPDLGRLMRLKTWQRHYLAWHERSRHTVHPSTLYGFPGRNWGFASRRVVRNEYARRLGVVRRRLVRIKMTEVSRG